LLKFRLNYYDKELTMNDTVIDEKYMKMAIKEAGQAARSGEVPVGAVLVKGDRVLAEDHNQCIKQSDPTAHAEVLVLRKAGEVLGNYRLNDTVMYVTIEPCPMCIFAMIHARISRLVFGTLEPKFGAVESRFKLLREKGLNHPLEVTRGILEKECTEILKSFFKKRRASKKTVRS
jgi:tRNA(Arg) A34 adenosine deaminase TadA